MTGGPRPILSNVCTYKAVADEAYREMAEDRERNVLRNPDFRGGGVKRFDPERTSFKQAMVSIVFTCILLEATLHLLIVGRCGKNRFEELDPYPCERKLEALGYGDEDLLRRAGRLRNARRELVHEKAHLEFNTEVEFTGELYRPKRRPKTLGRSWRASSTGSMREVDGFFRGSILVPRRRARPSAAVMPPLRPEGRDFLSPGGPRSGTCSVGPSRLVRSSTPSGTKGRSRATRNETAALTFAVLH